MTDLFFSLVSTYGAFVASGDLALFAVVLAAFAGVVSGDQVGFRAGSWGVTNVFLLRWLFSPLGPWVNLATGATGVGGLRFTVSDVLGEAIRVAL